MESRSSNRKLKPLPPDPGHHQDSAITPLARLYFAIKTDTIPAGPLHFAAPRAADITNFQLSTEHFAQLSGRALGTS
jgi:hypothetical protein